MELKRSATLSLITVICAAYLINLIHPAFEQDLFLIRRAILSDGALHGVGAGEWWRIFTVALVHGSIFHLGFNMYALMVLGNPLEMAFGKARFLLVFAISLAAGSAASLLLNPSNQPSVGASGAIFGLFGALAIAGKRIGADVRSITVVIALNFALSFVLSGIDWHAHIGGLVGGATAGNFLLKRPTGRW